MRFLGNLDMHEDYLRSIIFGFQDSLVSTTGVIAGVAAGSNSKELVILAGLVTITVESLSMGAGQYMSEKAVHQMDKSGKHTDNLYLVGGLMFFSYFLGGLVPLTPIILFKLPLSITISVVFALCGLFILGYLKAHIVKVNPFKSAIEIFILGGAATLIGLVVGRLFKV
ncbi:MAG: VIT1/CCC1 transporter family protein [Candidatus Levybacteria bacterium]|nr:VIT1/CCC1 transporter family protein [Candidatus Levybacteria bacterium]